MAGNFFEFSTFGTDRPNMLFLFFSDKHWRTEFVELAPQLDATKLPNQIGPSKLFLPSTGVTR
jgi:hypothetical protein